MKQNIIIGVLTAALLLAVSSAVYFWFADRFKPVVSQIEYIKVPEVKTVTKIERVTIPGPERIVTIEKPVIVDKLKLPDWVKSADKQVIATAEIAPHEGKTNAIAVLDVKTGISEIIAKQEPLPFLAFTRDKEVYVRAGYDTSLSVQGTVGGRWRFTRIGAIRVGFFAEASNRSGGEAVGGIEVSY